MRKIELVPLDHAAAQEQLSKPQVDSLIKRGLYPLPVAVSISRRLKRMYVPGHELNLRRALILSGASDSELAEKMSRSLAGRVAISADIQHEIASLVKEGDA